MWHRVHVQIEFSKARFHMQSSCALTHSHSLHILTMALCQNRACISSELYCGRLGLLRLAGCETAAVATARSNVVLYVSASHLIVINNQVIFDCHQLVRLLLCMFTKVSHCLAHAT